MAALLPDMPARPLSPGETDDVMKGRPVVNVDVLANGSAVSRFARLLAPDGVLARSRGSAGRRFASPRRPVCKLWCY
jgi:hypothetical protein